MGGKQSVAAVDGKNPFEFSRPCSSRRRSGDRCWLRKELPDWNRALFALGYELVEPVPGYFSLRFLQPEDFERGDVADAREAAALTSRLLQHHVCISDLRIVCATGAKAAPASFRLRPPSGQDSANHIRHMEVMARSTEVLNVLGYGYLEQENLDAIYDLEKLKVNAGSGNIEIELIGLLQRNVVSLRDIDVTGIPFSRRLVDTLLCLEKCESVALSLLGRDLHKPRCRSHALVGLKAFKFRPLIDPEWRLFGAVQTIRTSATLTTLDLCLDQHDDSPLLLFAAIGDNTSLKTVTVNFRCADTICGEVLASALRKNSSLRELDLRTDTREHFLMCIAEALSQNTTLEALVLKNSLVDFHGVLALCEALTTNKTLKKLLFPFFVASKEERVTLAEVLVRGDGYSRAQLHLTDVDMPALPPHLVSPTSSPKVLGSISITTISDANFRLFCEALALCSYVHTCSFTISHDPLAKTQMLGRMLKVNRSIEILELVMHRFTGGFVTEILQSLQHNRSVSELTMTSVNFLPETAPILSQFFTCNRSVTKFRLSYISAQYNEFVDALFPGLSTNPVIVDLELRAASKCDCKIRKADEIIRRNKAGLNRAVDFVIRRSTNKGCAEAFEHFCGKRCLLYSLMKTSGQAKCDALKAVASTEAFLRENFLVITGIVKTSLVCHPADDGCTQIDMLNTYCWRALSRYLKISDVVV